MARDAYLGLDLGGTGAKAGVFDPEGNMLGFGRVSYAVEIDPEKQAELPIAAIYDAARAAAIAAIRQGQVQVRALAISSQGQTFISLDAQDRPLHPAILWYDSRASQQAERLRRALTTRLPAEEMPQVDAIAAAPKILWLRDRHPAEMARARRFLLLPDYFAYRLTGRAVTDPIIAWTTGLYAQAGNRYCSAALAEAGIDEEQLAVIQPSGTPVGTVLPSMAREWELSPRTLLASGTNDQFAGALGAGNCRPGIVTETMGTCLALVTLVETVPEKLPGALFAGRFPIEAYSYILAYSKTAGIVLEWFNRELAGGTGLAELDRLASRVPIGSHGVTVVPHFDGMVSPVTDPGVRGAIANLGLQHGRAHIYRAILEALAFSLRENLELLTQAGLAIQSIRSIGGGAKSDFWLQMKADVTGRVLEKPAVTEAAVLGAAMLAAVGHGQFPSLGVACEALYRRHAVFTPDPVSHRLYPDPYRRYQTLCKCKWGTDDANF